MSNALDIIRNSSIDWKQKKILLALYAQNSLPYVKISEKASHYLKNGVIDDLGEGNAPCSPRYTLPDYNKFIKSGSNFLNLSPPQNLYDAVNNLQMLYNYVPSVTCFPVFLGKIDELLEPFADTVNDDEREHIISNFLIYIDRVLSDGFVHMNIGPNDTKIGRLVLKLEKELKKAVPNLSLLTNSKTPDSFLKLGIETALCTGKPYFANDSDIAQAIGDDYGIASCYNSLKIGGGSYTLVRLNLKKAAEGSTNVADFIGKVLPDMIKAQCEIINARARFIVEEVRFFENSFLAKEDILNIDNFTSMAGIYGLYECVEHLTNGLKIGHDDIANETAVKIINKVAELVKNENGLYCFGTQEKIGLHAQSLISSDVGVTAGVRIKIGEEPPIFDQIKIEGKLNQPFDTGVSDIYIFDKTAQKNTDGVLTIIKGAFKNGIKMFALNSSDSDLIRITGYLVKKSDIEKLNHRQILREDTVQLGAESIINQNIQGRKVRSID